MKEHRPWGYYEVLLDDTNVKVKKIVVNKGCRLSLQSHKHRSETWTVVQGMGKVTIDNSAISTTLSAVIISRRSSSSINSLLPFNFRW